VTVEELLGRLDGVRERGHGQWLARCPAHDDNGPSLSIKEGDDGRILLHCFAACPVADVAAALGLELSDLFPTKLEAHRGTRPRWNPRDLLAVIRHEAMVMEIAASRFDTLTAGELARVWLAGQRIRTALEVADVR
jgi:hypothetical protein